MNLILPNSRSGDASEFFGLAPGSLAWWGVDYYLKKKGTSLNRLKVQMGLGSEGWSRSQSIDNIKSVVLTHYQKEGSRPSKVTHPRVDDWLKRNHNISLSKFCNDLGLPGGRHMHRTVKECQAEVLAHFEEHGCRPTQKTHPHLESWLRNNEGRSLAVFCDDLDLPRLTRKSRRTEGCKKEIQTFYEREGRRPRVAEDGWRAWNSWLSRRGSSLRKICDEMGLPK